MTSRPSAREIDDEAAAWALRLEDERADGEHDPLFQTWLAGDPRRSGALLRAQAALNLIERARAVSGGKLGIPAKGLLTPSRRNLLIGGGAAGALAAGLGGLTLISLAEKRYITALGEIRRVPLDDGSMAVINTQSVLGVNMQTQTRNVHLHAGEAWFDVAKDKTRPFVVAAGPVRVRAVGTAFSVRRKNDDAEVMVTEGVVEAWLSGQEHKRVRVEAGWKIVLGPGAQSLDDAPKEIERNLAWIEGEISLDGESLSEAAAEFNRYNAKPILIEDPHLAASRFVGLFHTDDPKGFANAVAASTGATLAVDEQGFHLGRVRQ